MRGVGLRRAWGGSGRAASGVGLGQERGCVPQDGRWGSGGAERRERGSRRPKRRWWGRAASASCLEAPGEGQSRATGGMRARGVDRQPGSSSSAAAPGPVAFSTADAAPALPTSPLLRLERRADPALLLAVKPRRAWKGVGQGVTEEAGPARRCPLPPLRGPRADPSAVGRIGEAAGPTDPPVELARRRRAGSGGEQAAVRSERRGGNGLRGRRLAAARRRLGRARRHRPRRGRGRQDGGGGGEARGWV